MQYFLNAKHIMQTGLHLQESESGTKGSHHYSLIGISTK